MGLLAQYWKHFTAARLLGKETRFTYVEWSPDNDCIVVEMPDAEAEKFSGEEFQDHNNRLEFENDSLHSGWIFHVDRPYERLKPQPDRQTTKLSFRLSPAMLAAASKN
jgi:hypothetical protein